MAGRKRPIIWSPDSRTDLAAIWNYYVSIAGRHTADKVVRDITDACRPLRDYPFAGRPRNELRPGLRSVTASPHIIFYRVANDVPEIVRVLDGRQDLDEIFASDSRSGEEDD